MSNFQKQAGIGSTLKKIMQNGGAHLLGGAGTALGMDVMMNPDEEFLGGEWDKRRIGNTVLNAGLGALGGGLISTGKQKNIIAGLTALTSAPAKDLMLSLQSTVDKGNKALDATTAQLKNQPTDTLNNTLKWVGGGALGLGGLALLTQLFKKDKSSYDESPTSGTLKYKILGKKDDPNDDIEVELPIDTDKFTPEMKEQMDSYIKRQAKKSMRNNARKRDPETGKLIPYELYMKKYGPVKQASAEKSFTNFDKYGYETHVEETPSTTKEFYRLQAGAKLDGSSGSTVKSARVVHENIGDVAQWMLGAGAGGALGAAVTDKHPLGIIAGSLLGGIGPGILGRALARKQNVRSIEEQIEHDSQSPIGEYLIPGYADYQKERRAMLDRKILSDSFSSVGMNPMPTNHTPEHSKDTRIVEDEEEDEVFVDEEEEDYDDGDFKSASAYYDIIEKYANQGGGPAPAQKTGVGSGPAPAPVKNTSNTAVRAGKTGDTQNVMHAMTNVQSTIANTKLS